MALFQKYNNENILVRAVLAGILNVLNNQIKYEQKWSNEDVEVVKVPWYYNQSGDERFMQDFFTHYGDCEAPRPADGNFDFVPRGVITYKGGSIDSQRITSRFVQGKFVKEEQGQLNQYVSFLYSIPLRIPLECELRIDNHLSALKIEQELREVFYKNVTYYVYFKGKRVGCTAGFPETYDIQKNIEYSFESDNEIKMNFNLEVETYHPVFDPTTEMKASNKIKNIAYNLYDKDNEGRNELVVTSPKPERVLPKGMSLWIEWVKTKEDSIINKIDITYKDVNSGESDKIAVGADNQEYYVWEIPDNFTSFNEPNIIWEQTEQVSIIRDPLLKIVPNTTTGEITESSFNVIESGYFKSPIENYDASISITLEMEDDSGNISYSDDNSLFVNLKYNKIDKDNPVTMSKPIQFPGTVGYKVIDILVSSSHDGDVFGSTTSIKIV